MANKTFEAENWSTIFFYHLKDILSYETFYTNKSTPETFAAKIVKLDIRVK